MRTCHCIQLINSNVCVCIYAKLDWANIHANVRCMFTASPDFPAQRQNCKLLCRHQASLRRCSRSHPLSQRFQSWVCHSAKFRQISYFAYASWHALAPGSCSIATLAAHTLTQTKLMSLVELQQYDSKSGSSSSSWVSNTAKCAAAAAAQIADLARE